MRGSSENEDDAIVSAGVGGGIENNIRLNGDPSTLGFPAAYATMCASLARSKQGCEMQRLRAA